MTNQNDNKLSLSILNYFAAFTETKFNFRTLINYRWTNDELTLGLGVFQPFQELLIDKIRAGDPSPVVVKKNHYILTLSHNDVLVDIEKALAESFGLEYLKSCIQQELEKIVERDKQFIVSEKGTQSSDTDQPVNTERQNEKAFQEGVRKYNLALRKQLEHILIGHQDKKLETLKTQYGITSLPSSIFNSTHFLRTQFDAWQLLAAESEDAEDYLESLRGQLKDSLEDIILYDLFINLQKYAHFHNTGTQYLFFHELSRTTAQNGREAYPLFFIEVDFALGTEEVTISFPRNLVFINTPAVNYFRFPSVLTTSRSSTFQNAVHDIGGIETFLQSQYGLSEPFAVESTFKRISAPDNHFPDINCQIGFQIVQKENKRLLDYSEIMTSMLTDGSSKFGDFITNYINGNVENTQGQVDRQYQEQYLIKSPRRYVADNPLPLNNAQKRILLSLNNPKNEIVVVDGPPGTGKSHTIAALMYWANQENKSVVITSHKKEALDVIDRMLTEKFKTLHPKAKPAIIRFGKNGKSLNTLENTLQNAVINAAGNRAHNYNEQATIKDAETITARVEEKLEDKLSSAETYAQTIEDLCVFEQIQQQLVETGLFTPEELNLPKVESDVFIYFDEILRFAANEHFDGLKQMALAELKFLLKNKSDIPKFVQACEAINLHDKEYPANIQTSHMPDAFVKLVETGLAYFKSAVPVSQLTAEDIAGGFIKKLLKKQPSKEERQAKLNALKSLKYKNILDDIAAIKGISPETITLHDISTGVEELQAAISVKRHQDIIQEYRSIAPHNKKTISDIYQTLNAVIPLLEDLSLELFTAISELFTNYDGILSKLQIIQENLYSLSRLNYLSGSEADIWQWIRLHYRLSRSTDRNTIAKEDLDDHYVLKQKEVEHKNDTRLKNLNNHLTDIAKIKVSYDGGKRFTSEQAQVLLKNISGLIAEPDMIARFFPMDEDMIDLLIIDEASQVSIANSISLILRAKQVVVLGDEYQYGAVSAVHVSSKYSASYFREIIHAYSHDYNISASEQEAASLIEAVSQESDDEKQEVEPVFRPQDMEGTILWLKTFNIRTSTLHFAKAIANYTVSLQDHYRSFPELIDYSNEFFYKPAQLELTPNRIRTRPIGQVLQFMPVETRGNSGRNVNLDEIDAIINDIKARINDGFKGSIGIIASFKEQQARLERALGEQTNLPELKRNHNLAVWFVGDVQGEERDLVYYSFVEDKQYGNADLRSIYPVIDGTADNIRSLKMQRLNVGFSRAKDAMVFVHSMPINDYSRSRLGDALKHFNKLLNENSRNDFFVEDTSVFDSPAEEHLYQLLINTEFVKSNRSNLKIVPQFQIGEYIRAEFATQIPKYRVDFLLTFSKDGREQALILEYDGVEFHTKNPDTVTRHNFSQQYLDYDISRQIELESYGYRFLRLNKFTLRPEQAGETSTDVLNRLLHQSFGDN